MIDLHMHTNKSDGEFDPRKVVEKAIQKGLKAIAITDHDVIDGVKEAIDYSNGRRIEVIGGIEIGCDESSLGFKEVHVIGLFVDYKDKGLIKFTENIKCERTNQKRIMIKKINDLGFDIPFEEVVKRSRFTAPCLCFNH